MPRIEADEMFDAEPAGGGIDVDVTVSSDKSLPGSPVVLINIPEPYVVGNFTYNLYVKDERTNDSGIQLLIDQGDTSGLLELWSRMLIAPRFNLISIMPNEGFVENSNLYPDNWHIILSKLKSTAAASPYTVLKKILKESAIPNGFFSAGYLRDNQLDRVFYTALSGSASYFTGIDTAGITPEAAADLLLMRTNITGSYFSDGVEIREALLNLQAQGVKYSSLDTSENLSIDSARNVNLVDFGQNYHNLFVGDIYAYSSEDPLNAFYEEIVGLYPQAERTQNYAKLHSDPTKINADEFDLTWEPLYEEVAEHLLPASRGFTSDGDLINEASSALGYIIEKYEIKRNGTVRRHTPIIAFGHDMKTFLDEKIRYGASYVYNVRSFGVVRFEALTADSDLDGTEDQIVFAGILIASKGRYINLYAVDSVPPPDIDFIKVSFDYENDCSMLWWQPPLTSQQDVVKYQIFRRDNVEQPFVLLKQLDFDNSTDPYISPERVPKRSNIKLNGERRFFRDLSFIRDKEYIYSIVAIDAHGLSSNYSVQIGVKFDSYMNKLLFSHISQPGAPRPYPNLFLSQDLFVDAMKDSGSSRLRIFFDAEYYKILEKSVVEETDAWGDSFSATKLNNLRLLAKQYKLQLINVDDQQAQVIDIVIDDETGRVRNITNIGYPNFSKIIGGGVIRST